MANSNLNPHPTGSALPVLAEAPEGELLFQNITTGLNNTLSYQDIINSNNNLLYGFRRLVYYYAAVLP